MGTRLYVGNLPYTTNDEQLRAMFQEIGQTPREVRIITDRMTGQSRGFAFVEVADGTAAHAAIEALHGKPFGGRTLTVNEARERDATRPPGGGGGGGGGMRGPGGGGGGGYGPRPGGPPRPGGFGGGPGGGGGAPRSFGGPPRSGFGGGPPRANDKPDRDRERDRFERKKQKRRRDYGDGDDEY